MTIRFLAYRISRFFEPNSTLQQTFGLGDPEAVVFEDTQGTVHAIMGDHPHFDEAVALLEEWMVRNAPRL